MRGAVLATLAVGLTVPFGPALPQDGPDIVVVGVRPPEDIIVRAPPHCYRRPGDPADAVAVHKGVTGQRVIAPDRTGALEWRTDNEPVLGEVWQRAGNAIGEYRYRVPVGPEPLCIGALARSPSGYGQLRRIVDATAMQGRYVHFSALVATRDAAEVRFWIAAGDKANTRSVGGDTHNYPIRGTHGWRRVDLLIGPVPRFANHVSYGFLLYGRGDVWLAEPALAVLSREQALQVRPIPVDRLLPDHR